MTDNQNFEKDINAPHKEQIIIDGCNVSGCENYRPKDRFTCYPYICNYYCSDDNSNTFQNRYIEVLLCQLSKNYDSWDNKFQKIIKQAIRNEKWEI